MQAQPPPSKHGSPAFLALAVALVVIIVTGGIIAGLVYFTQPRTPSNSNDSNNSNNSNDSNSSHCSSSSTGSGRSSCPDNTTPPPRPTSSPIYDKLWTDPKEGAFSVQMPDGWSASPNSGVARPYFGADFYFNATNSKGTISVFFENNGYPDFVEPLPSTSFSCSGLISLGLPPDPLCNQGSWWTPISTYPSFSAYIWPYVSAQDFAKSFFLHHLQKGHPEATLISSSDRPDLASSFVDLVLTQTQTGADALYSYTVNGVSYRLGLVITTLKLNVNTYSGDPFTMWFYAYTGVSSPASDFSSGANATALYSQIIPTVRISKTWLQKEIQNQATNSQLISQTFSRIQQMDYRTFIDTSNSNYAIGRAWGNALGGVQDYVDSSGAVHTVDTPPLGYDYVWGDSTGGVVYTATDQSPGSGFVLWNSCGISSTSCGV